MSIHLQVANAEICCILEVPVNCLICKDSLPSEQWAFALPKSAVFKVELKGSRFKLVPSHELQLGLMGELQCTTRIIIFWESLDRGSTTFSLDLHVQSNPTFTAYFGRLYSTIKNVQRQSTSCGHNLELWHFDFSISLPCARLTWRTNLQTQHVVPPH